MLFHVMPIYEYTPANRATMLASKATGFEAKIYNAWQQSFRRYRESNDELNGANDSDFERGLAEEIKILESLRNSITGDSGVADNWRKDLDEDIALWKKCFTGRNSMTHRFLDDTATTIVITFFKLVAEARTQE